MNRRTLVGASASLLMPQLVLGQTATTLPRIGVLIPAAAQFDEAVFTAGLRDAGFVHGRNVTVDIRSAEGNFTRLPALARELVAARANVILSINSPATQAAVEVSQSVPIVFAVVANPVALGFVSNLARPGGNVTGFSNRSDEIVLKRLQLLRQVAPAAGRVLVLYHPGDPISALQLRALETSAASLDAAYLAVPVSSDADLDRAFGEATAWQANAVLRLSGQSGLTDRLAIERSLRLRMPAMFNSRAAVQAGALLCYFPNNLEILRRSAAYVARILRGERPGDLPVEGPNKFDLFINQRTAESLGLKVPPALLALADEVIE